LVSIGAAVPQPPPATTGRSRVVLDDLVVLLRERAEFGQRKYGVRLETFNGRDAHLDALQELLDLFVYLHQAQMERAALEREVQALREWATRASDRETERGRTARLLAELVDRINAAAGTVPGQKESLFDHLAALREKAALADQLHEERAALKNILAGEQERRLWLESRVREFEARAGG